MKNVEDGYEEDKEEEEEKKEKAEDDEERRRSEVRRTSDESRARGCAGMAGTGSGVK